ncbi:MAG: hypothetical protein M1834_006925 [Cirrosporium novae-zelandiae]|nr:MAG: hypothetical protein M1834_006925 [Cirrosporium novae-zelandiae]
MGLNSGPEQLPSTSSAEEVITILRRDGGVIIRNLVAHDILDQAARDIAVHIKNDKEWDGITWPKESRRVTALAGKSRTFATQLLTNPLYQEVCRQMLSRSTTVYYGDEKVTSTSLPQVTNTMAFWVGPGSEAQGLHRDDQCHHTRHPAKYETDIGIMFAGTKSTREMGTTNIVPGSHKWDDERKPTMEETVPAEMEKGDALIWLGSTYHGAGQNTTTNEFRLLMAAFMTPGWCRQDENQFLAIPWETVKTYPVEVQKLLGYYVSRPYGGLVELTEPLDFLAANGDVTKIQFQDLI